ncbi:MAG: prepilin-type N-terminal cleavage/methylation domain-containing protein [Duganella sp.]
MMRANVSNRRQQGFTLVEAIVAIVLTAILAGTMVLFINRPVRNYIDSAARAELSDAADLALRRMARELRASLPNSMRLTTAGGVQFLEFIPTSGGGRYLSVEDAPNNGTPLSFTAANAQTFSVAGAMAGTPFPAGVRSYIAIYNLGPGFQDADAYAASNLAQVTAVNTVLQNGQNFLNIAYANILRAESDAANPISPWANPFAEPFRAGRSPNTSPEQRFQVVQLPVIFRCAGNVNGTGTLTRSVAATFSTVASTPAANAGALLADNVVSCNFTMGTNANRQTALVGLNLTLGRMRPDGGLETVSLTHQINVNNMP